MHQSAPKQLGAHSSWERTLLSVNLIADEFDLEFSEDFEIRNDAIALIQERIRSAPISTQAALATFRPLADPSNKM